MRELHIVWKLLGGLAGLAIAGPLGAVVGVILGHSFDTRSPLVLNPKPHNQSIQQLFLEKTFLVMGYLAKTGGRVTEQHIQLARAVMTQMGLGENKRREAILFFNKGKQHADFNLSLTCKALLRQLGAGSPMLHLFLEIQFNTAYVNGELLSFTTQEALQIMCAAFGVDFTEWIAKRQKEKTAGQRDRPPQQRQQMSLPAAYAILQLTGRETDIEIKQTYRKLISLHHPDKLMARGLDADKIKLATEKTQQIQTAYETIRVARALV